MTVAKRNSFKKKAAVKRGPTTAKKSTSSTGKRSGAQKGAAAKVAGSGRVGMKPGSHSNRGRGSGGRSGAGSSY